MLDDFGKLTDARLCIDDLLLRLAQANELVEFADLLMEYVCRRWQVPAAGLQIIDYERRMVWGSACRGLNHLSQSDLFRRSLIEYPLSENSSVAWIAKTHSVIHADSDRVKFLRNNPAELCKTDYTSLIAQQIQEIVMLPILQNDHCIGVIQLARLRQHDAPLDLSPEIFVEVQALLAKFSTRLLQLVLSRRNPYQTSSNDENEEDSSGQYLDKVVTVCQEDIRHLLDWEFFSFESFNDEKQIFYVEHMRSAGENVLEQNVLNRITQPLSEFEAVNLNLCNRRLITLDYSNDRVMPASLRIRLKRHRVDKIVLLPLWFEGRLRGMLTLGLRGNEFDLTLEKRLVIKTSEYAQALIYGAEFRQMKDDQRTIASANEKQASLLNFLDRLHALDNAENLYEQITEGLLHFFDFDMSAIVLRQHSALEAAKITVINKQFAEQRDRWRMYYRDTRYAIDPFDGATSAVYTGNLPVLHISDVSALDESLSMSDKDRGALALLDSPRTFFMVPINFQGKAIGVLWLVSLENVSTVSDRDIDLLVLLGNFLGTVIKNAELFSTVERQKRELSLNHGKLLHAERSRVEALQRAKSAAEETARTKSWFLANVSHEIRTPLNAVIGFAELAAKAREVEDAQRYVKKIRASSKNLLGLVNDILDFSKIESGKLQLENQRYCLFDVVESMRDMFLATMEKKNIQFSIHIEDDIPKYVRGDSMRLGQVLTNLVSNAFKFTPNGGDIQLHIEKISSSTESSVLFFQVKDSGVGMTEEEMSRLFQPFSQANASTSREYGGTGLGLSICKTLVELMGGEIGVLSQKDSGSSFYFSVSVANVETQSADNALENETLSFDNRGNISLEGKRILVAEDNSINREIIQEMLSDQDIKLFFAENGQQALDLALEQEFDLILMDMEMPVMNGIDAAKSIRERRIETPIVALTGHSTESSKELCFAAGMNDYIVKPFDFNSTVRLIASWLNRDTALS